MKTYIFLFAATAAVAAPLAAGRKNYPNDTRHRPATNRRGLSKSDKSSKSKSSKSKSSKNSRAGHYYETSAVPHKKTEHRPARPAANMFNRNTPASSKSKASKSKSGKSKSGKASSSDDRHHHDHGAAFRPKYSKSRGSKSLKSTKTFGGSNSSKSLKTPPSGTSKAEKGDHANLFAETDKSYDGSTDTSITTNSSSPPTPTIINTEASDDLGTNDSTKSSLETPAETACTGPPCPTKGHCRIPSDGTCGPGRIYCNELSIWTWTCPTLSPSGAPATSSTNAPTPFDNDVTSDGARFDGPPRPPGPPRPSPDGTVGGAELVDRDIASSDGTDGTNPLDGQSPGWYLDGANSDGQAGNNAGLPVENNSPLPVSANGEGSDEGGGFPAVGYVGIAFAACLAVGSGAIVKTELEQRALRAA